MAVTQSQIVDLLYKQAFGVTKTDTSTNKSPSNESIPSPALNRGDTLWTQANQIPSTAAATAGIVQAYVGVNAVQCTADLTTVPIGSIYPTWKTNLTYWIPSEFGSTYNAQVWVDGPGVANPTVTGTQIFADGSAGSGQYYYNYQSGVLNFIGESIPTALGSGKVLYIVGYRYIGLTGVTNLPNGTTIGNLSFTNNTISSTVINANINLTPNGNGTVVSTANIYAPTFFGDVFGNISGEITIPGANTGVVFKDGNIANTSNAFTFNKASNTLTLNGILSVTGNASIGGNLDMTANAINNVLDPVQAQDAATKSYVDTMASTGITYHSPVNVATTITLAAATGGTITYNNGASGVGANLVTTGAFLLIDGANVQTVGTRILVKDEANAVFNGIYTYANTTTLVRATDADEYGIDSPTQISVNDYFFTLGGVVNEGAAFVVNAPIDIITFGTSDITFATFSVSQVYDAGDGLTLTGTSFSVNTSQPNITSVGTLTALTVANTATVGNLIVANTGTISGANIVSANTFNGTTLSATGTATVGNLSIANGGNIFGANVVSANTFSASGNVTADNLTIANSSTSGSLSVTGLANVGSLTTLTTVFALGDVTGGNLVTGGVVTATGNVSGANIVAANAVYGVNAFFTGNITTNNLTVNLELTGNTATFSGNIVSLNANLGNLALANFINVSSNLNVTDTANVGNLRTDHLLYANGQPWDLQEAAGSNRQIQFNDGNNNFAANANLTYDKDTSTLTVVGTVNATSIIGEINIPGDNTGVVFKDGNIANTSNAFTFNKTSNVVTIAGNLNIGNTTVGSGTVTTTAITANQTIAQFSTTGIAAIEFLVKGVDAAGAKYSVATVTAITNGSTVDYITYATAFLTSGTGSLAVNISGGNVALQVTPSSSNSTVWTTQYRVM